MTKEQLIAELKTKAVKSRCMRTGKASWTIDWYGNHFVVVSKGFRAPSVDIYDDSIKNTRKELISCIQAFFTDSTLLEMKSR